MKLIWSDTALSDLESIRDHIARDSEENATRFLGQLTEAARLFERFPEAGQLIPKYGNAQVREFVWKKYRILYQVQPDHVWIFAVIHAARDISSINLMDR
jgi:toxin ParE1/3/4